VSPSPRIANMCILVTAAPLCNCRAGESAENSFRPSAPFSVGVPQCGVRADRAPTDEHGSAHPRCVVTLFYTSPVQKHHSDRFPRLSPNSKKPSAQDPQQRRRLLGSLVDLALPFHTYMMAQAVIFAPKSTSYPALFSSMLISPISTLCTGVK
jgi:hypothetical protein